MSDDTQTTTAAPVDQAPAQASIATDPAQVNAIAAAVVALLQNGAPPPSTAAAPAPVDQTAPVDEPHDAVPAAAAWWPGAIALYPHDHFGTTKYQVLLVVGTYDESVTDPKTGATSTVHRARLLPLGTAHETADLPVDQLTAPDAIDWERAA